jgi:hypothetical protein
MPIYRSYLQRNALADLKDGKQIHAYYYGLAGKAAQYTGRYQESWSNFVDRCRKNGLNVQIVKYGPKGGKNSALWAIVK